MKIDMQAAEILVREFRAAYGIPPELPYKLGIEMWHHKNKPLTVECHISIFTTDNKILQGSGADFTDALAQINLRSNSKEVIISSTQPVEVVVPECT